MAKGTGRLSGHKGRLLLLGLVSSLSAIATNALADETAAGDMPQGFAAEFNQLDINHDGQLAFIELLPRLEEAGLGGKWDEARVLGKFDDNGDGELEPREFQDFRAEVLLDGAEADGSTSE